MLADWLADDDGGKSQFRFAILLPKRYEMGGYFHPPLSSLCSTVFFICVHKRSKRRRRTGRIKKLLLLYRCASSSAIFISTSRVAQLICLYPCRNSASVFSPKTNQNPTISFYWPTESLFCLSVCLSTCHWTHHQPGYVALVHFGSSTTTIPPPQISVSSLSHISMAIVLGQECLLCKHFYHP